MKGTFGSTVRRYLEAQLSGDRMQALGVLVDAALAGATIAELLILVVQAAQHEIGRLWQENQLSIAEEHVATAISQFVMAYLFRHFPRQPRNAKKVLIGCVEGELHT